MKNRFSKIHMLSFRICVVQMCTVCTAFTHFISAGFFLMCYISVSIFLFQVFSHCFCILGQIHTNNTLIL